jgi:hypothetical protein
MVGIEVGCKAQLPQPAANQQGMIGNSITWRGPDDELVESVDGHKGIVRWVVICDW